jgi:hypothetical protein
MPYLMLPFFLIACSCGPSPSSQRDNANSFTCTCHPPSAPAAARLDACAKDTPLHRIDVAGVHARPASAFLVPRTRLCSHARMLALRTRSIIALVHSHACSCGYSPANPLPQSHPGVRERSRAFPRAEPPQSGRPVAPTGLYSALATLPCVGVHFAQPYRTIALSIHGNNPCKDQPKRLTVFPFGNQSGALTAAHVRLGSLKSSPQPHRQRPLYATPSMQCRRAYIPASTRESN